MENFNYIEVGINKILEKNEMLVKSFYKNLEDGELHFTILVKESKENESKRDTDSYKYDHLLEFNLSNGSIELTELRKYNSYEKSLTDNFSDEDIAKIKQLMSQWVKPKYKITCPKCGEELMFLSSFYGKGYKCLNCFDKIELPFEESQFGHSYAEFEDEGGYINYKGSH